MPRPGQGTGGSSRASSGHSPSARQSSGHRISTSSANRRPQSGMQGRSAGNFSSSSRNFRPSSPGFGNRSPLGGFGGYRSTPRRPIFIPGVPLFGSRNRRYTNQPPMQDDYYDYGRPRRSSGMSIAVTLVIVVILMLVFFSMFGCSSSGNTYDDSKVTESAYNRQKLETSIPYNEDCIVDELGWFENIPQTEQRLKYFYDKTGVQPMIVIKEYDPSLKTDQQKSDYAKTYYDTYIPEENVFLYMYFGEPGDQDVGYMEAVNGKEISAVMDQNAVNIFWNYLDQAWTSDMNSDDLFVSVFDKTADRIMTKTATKNDVLIKGLGVAAIILVIGGIAAILIIRRKHERERAEETQRILSTPLDSQINSDQESNEDDLLKRYGGH